MKCIDLSSAIQESPEGTPDFMKTEIMFHSHAEGAAQIKALLQVPSELLRNGEGWATETITRLGTHDTTHVDAPWHYNSSIKGEEALTIDRLPLEWFFGEGVKLDMTHKGDGEAVTVEDIHKELENISYTIHDRDIVLIYTGRDSFYNTPEYIFRGCGVTMEATRWLYEQGVRVMGIDAWGWDAPLNIQAEAALREGKPGIFWPAHQADLQYCHIERLVNLRDLPPSGFRVSCFPLKITGASAGPARVVAILS
ncbi:MAG TPA: cyclase family protein [Spirochaetota bacterium]|nr:cyclase family protein [Spirochaetota bacterium]HPQ54809.1 cyclase family protein [Spirochaetota bacterium]